MGITAHQLKAPSGGFKPKNAQIKTSGDTAPQVSLKQMYIDLYGALESPQDNYLHGSMLAHETRNHRPLNSNITTSALITPT